MILTRYDTHTRRFHFDSEIRLRYTGNACPAEIDSPARHAPSSRARDPPARWHSRGMGTHEHDLARRGASGAGTKLAPSLKKALLRTISSHGTGPSRHERPTLAFKSEDGGAVHDGPLAKDAGILPGGWEQGYCRCSRRQANATGGSAVGSAGGVGSARAAARQPPDTGSSRWA